MATTNIDHAADVQLTCTLASLASSSTFTAGREATAVDNTTNQYVDALLSGKITVGTTPTADTSVYVYVFAPINDTPTWPDVFDGTDSAETVTSEGVGRGFLKLVATLAVDSATSDRVYPFGPVSVAAAFGGTMPSRWGVFITHNTGVALNSTGTNHEISYQGVEYTSA